MQLNGARVWLKGPGFLRCVVFQWDSVDAVLFVRHTRQKLRVSFLKMMIASTSKIPRTAALAAACSACLLMGFSAQASAEGAESWREFARRSMMPDYSWNDAPSAASLAPTLRSTVFGARSKSVTLALSGGNGAVRRSLNVSFDATSGTGVDTHSITPVRAVDFQNRQSPLRSRFIDTTYEQDVRGGGTFGVSALIAQQQFATPGFGLMAGMYESELLGASALRAGPSEVVSGQGVRLDYRLPLNQQFAWRWTAQSKLEMNTFDSVRGIYAEPGNFDLPARLGLQAEWNARGNLAFTLGMEQVYFSDITPFTSNALPARLLSLMSDGQAPAFAWRDLTVYSAEGRYADRWQGEWLLRYSTRQQPFPTSELYRRALHSEYTDTNLMFGYQRALGLGEIALTASYASSMALLGPGSAFSSRTYSRGANAEFEAFWVVPF